MSELLSSRPRVGLFVTCLIDLMRPSVGFAAAKLIEAAGCEVVVPNTQTCCGQPAYNSGDMADARDIARGAIDAFDGLDYIVAPSGSCAGMLKSYPKLLSDDATHATKAVSFAERVWELMAFLVDVRGMTSVDAACHARATYHDSCSGLRELGIKGQPRQLLASVKGLSLVEMGDPEVCCGFGGTFALKFPDISNAIVERKAADVTAAGADMLLAGDLGCLMNMAGKLKRQGRNVEVRHVAEVLAQELSAPGIGQSEGSR
jgi:L-lactate dehydrogenase complex protein LldE